MPLVKTVHLGQIEYNNEVVCCIIRSSRKKIIDELNSWFFDYFRNHNETILQLPPLDDWTHSQENVSVWSIAFPSVNWKIIIQHDIVDFSE